MGNTSVVNREWGWCICVCVCTNVERVPKPIVKGNKAILKTNVTLFVVETKYFPKQNMFMCTNIQMHSNIKKEAWEETQPTIDGGYHIPKRCGSRLEVGSKNNFLILFIILIVGVLFFPLQWEYICVLYICPPPKKYPCTRKLGLMSKSLNFWKCSMLCINVSQQCLFIVHILKVCLVFHSSFFSDVCDYAWNKKLIRALLSQPQKLLWKYIRRAAGS